MDCPQCGNSNLYECDACGFNFKPKKKPIESAPKDGTPIIVFGKGEFWSGPAIVHWDNDEWVGSLGDAGSTARIFNNDIQPTHWKEI